MKYCEDYAALLDAFADGELPEAEMARVQAHLESCPGCRAYVDDVLAIRAGFPDVEDTIVPEGFTAGVMERVRKAAKTEAKTGKLQKRRSARRWAEALTALAACCALVISLRSGPGGLKQDGAAAPEGGEAALAYDCQAADATEAGSQAEEALPQLAASAAGGEAKSRAAEENSGSGSGAENGKDATPFAALPAAAAPEAAMDAAPGREPALRLSAEEAGEALDGFTPAWESGEERGYELSAGEYQALLEALGRTEERMAETEALVLVVVSGPFA